jgi:hypothetical protein
VVGLHHLDVRVHALHHFLLALHVRQGVDVLGELVEREDVAISAVGVERHDNSRNGAAAPREGSSNLPEDWEYCPMVPQLSLRDLVVPASGICEGERCRHVRDPCVSGA